MEIQRDRHRHGTLALQWCLGAIIALVVLKFLVLLAESDWNAAQAPWGLLIVVVVPAFILLALLPRYPRAGAAVTAALLVLFMAFVVSALARDGLARESWADYPLAYGGLLVAAGGLFWAVRVVRDSRPRTARREVDTGV